MTQFVVLQNVFDFLDSNALHLCEIMYLDIMVNRNFFLALMKLFNRLNITQSLRAHLVRPKLKNTMYALPHVENEIIKMGKNIIKKYLVDRIRSSNNFFRLVDEIISFNKEVINLCVQFVNHSNQRGFFLQYVKLNRVTGLLIVICVLKGHDQ